ncbi:hypothetical protein ACTQ5R_05800 [Ruoffia tabacinasalis]|uniref:hypothetical protein n=1 Tax=Ruoffia tabacinasalis TaxID=87458 RepID=UPI003F99281E
MKRNKVTILWLFIMVIVTLILWLVAMQFNPLHVQSQSDDTDQDTVMEWERLDFMLQGSDSPENYVRIQYQNNEFNHLLTDVNSLSWYTQSLYDEIYSEFPITNRPNLREYQVLNASDHNKQFWYKSPYLMDRDDEPLTFAYKIIDREQSEYIENTYTFDNDSAYMYSYLSYAEDESTYYVLLLLSNEQFDQSYIQQLSIDKDSGEVIADELVDYQAEEVYPLAPLVQNEKPRYHIIGLGYEPRSDSNQFYGNLYYYNNQKILAIDPATLELIEIEMPSMEEANSSSYQDVAMAMIEGEKLYYLINDLEGTSEGEITLNELKLYQYDWQEDEFTEVWAKELEEGQAFTIQFSQVYLETVEDKSQARIDKIQLDSGEVEATKEFTLEENANYEIVSLEFLGLN